MKNIDLKPIWPWPLLLLTGFFALQAIDTPVNDNSLGIRSIASTQEKQTTFLTFGKEKVDLKNLSFSGINPLVDRFVEKASNEQQELGTLLKAVARIENTEKKHLASILKLKRKIQEKSTVLNQLKREKQALTNRVVELYEQKGMAIEPQLEELHSLVEKEMQLAAQDILEAKKSLKLMAEAAKKTEKSEAKEVASEESDKEATNTASSEKLIKEEKTIKAPQKTQQHIVVCQQKSEQQDLSGLFTSIEKLVEQQTQVMAMMKQFNETFMVMTGQMIQQQADMIHQLQENGPNNYGQSAYSNRDFFQFQTPGMYYNPMYGQMSTLPTYGNDNTIYHGDVHYHNSGAPQTLPSTAVASPTGIMAPNNQQNLGGYYNFNSTAPVSSESFYQANRYVNTDFEQLGLTER